jgi:hypothetical protein
LSGRVAQALRLAARGVALRHVAPAVAPLHGAVQSRARSRRRSMCGKGLQRRMAVNGAISWGRSCEMARQAPRVGPRGLNRLTPSAPRAA